MSATSANLADHERLRRRSLGLLGRKGSGSMSDQAETESKRHAITVTNPRGAQGTKPKEMEGSQVQCQAEAKSLDPSTKPKDKAGSSSQDQAKPSRSQPSQPPMATTTITTSRDRPRATPSRIYTECIMQTESYLADADADSPGQPSNPPAIYLPDTVTHVVAYEPAFPLAKVRLPQLLCPRGNCTASS